MAVLITGSSGLIGGEAVDFFCQKGFDVIGIDNNMREYFFGEEGSTEWNRKRLEDKYSNYKCYDYDIRSETLMEYIFSKYDIDLVIHAAAQPSHDWAAKDPFMDFSDGNAGKKKTGNIG